MKRIVRRHLSNFWEYLIPFLLIDCVLIGVGLIYLGITSGPVKYEDVKESLWAVEKNGRGVCTAFVYRDEYVITASHCVQKKKRRKSSLLFFFSPWLGPVKEEVTFRNEATGERIIGDRVGNLPLHDVAVYWLRPDLEGSLDIDDDILRLYDTFTAFSYDRSGLPLFTEGVISNHNTAIVLNTSVKTFTGEVHGGNSGGPAINDSGDVVGIIVSHHRGTLASYVSPASYWLESIDLFIDVYEVTK